MNSFIPWVGGKSQLRKQILELFPQEPPERYIEVFGGAGWILFAKDGHAKQEIFNDFDGNLINLYRCIQHHREELERQLRTDTITWIPNSRELFFTFKQQLEVSGLTDIQRAARYFYIIRQSYGADRRSFSCKQVPINSALDRLPEIQQRLKNVVIENRDFEKLIKTYDKPTALLYLDPPYYGTENCYDGFTKADHLRVQTVLANVKGKFILSYNDHPDVRQLYSGYNIVELERSNCLQTKSTKDMYREVVIRNW